MRIRQLQDLRKVRDALADQAARAAAEQQARKEAQRRAQAERDLFASAVGPVQPLSTAERISLRPAPPPPLPVQQQLDDQAVLREALSDEFDASTLLDTDDHLSFRRSGIGRDVTHKLRRGDWRVQGEIDLHGLRTEEARDALASFVRESHRKGLRCLRVVHGKGHGSPGKTPVLKNKVHGWLIQKNQVLAFVQARPSQGGAGALVVLLAPV